MLDLRSDNPWESTRVVAHRLKRVTSARIAADGNWLVIPQNESLTFVNVPEGTVCSVEVGGSLEGGRMNYYSDERTGFTLSADGRWLLFVGSLKTGTGMIGVHSLKVRLWDMKGESRTPTIKIERSIFGNPIPDPPSPASCSCAIANGS